MRIAIRNIKDNVHTICRTNGQKINISPNKAIILETDSEQEISYWTGLKKSVLKRCGLSVHTTDNEIEYLIFNGWIESPNQKKTDESNSAQKKQMVYEDVSIMDNCGSPIARQIAMATMQNKEASESIEEEVIDDKYTEENLLKLSKEDLFNICDNFNIKYRKNNSVKTLVGLILGSGVL